MFVIIFFHSSQTTSKYFTFLNYLVFLFKDKFYFLPNLHIKMAIPTGYTVPSLNALSHIALLRVGIVQLSTHPHIHPSAHPPILTSKNLQSTDFHIPKTHPISMILQNNMTFFIGTKIWSHILKLTFRNHFFPLLSKHFEMYNFLSV